MTRPLVRVNPHWPLPPGSMMKRATPPQHLLKHFQEWNAGLQEVRIHVLNHTAEDGKPRAGELCRFLMPTRGRMPTADEICRLTWLRGEKYVRTHRRKTNFRIHLVGLADGRGFNHQARFHIKPQEVFSEEEESDELEDGEEEGDELEDGEEEEGDEEGEEEEDHEEDHEEIDEAYDGSEEPEPDWDRDAPSALMPIEERIEATGERHLVPQQLNPAFMVHLMRGSMGLAQRAFSGPMKENRMLVHEMRQEMSAFFRDTKVLTEMLINKALDIDRRAEERSYRQEQRMDNMLNYLTERLESAEERERDHARLNAAHYENLQEFAKQGWKAFIDGMRMKSDVVHDRMEFARMLEEQAMSREPPAALPSQSGARSLMEQASESPILIGGLAALMRKFGNDRDAGMFEKIAVNLSKNMDDEEEDEEEADGGGDAYDVEARAHPGSNGRDHGPFVGQPDGPSAAPARFADRLRRFQASLDADKTAAMKKILPKGAWRAYQAACGATTDVAAKAAVRAMKEQLGGDKMRIFQLAEHLSEDQITEILAIIETVKERPKPPRPAPPRPEPPAE